MRPRHGLHVPDVPVRLPRLGISFQPAHKGRPGRRARSSGASPRSARCSPSTSPATSAAASSIAASDAEQAAAWSMAELQDLLDEWIVAVWQNRPHDGLRHPLHAGQGADPEREVRGAGRDRRVCAGPAVGARTTSSCCPRHGGSSTPTGSRSATARTTAQALNPYRRQHSGVTARKGLWEVHHDPYDVSRIWVRNHQDGGWIPAPWTYLKTAARRRSANRPGTTHAGCWPAAARTASEPRSPGCRDPAATRQPRPAQDRGRRPRNAGARGWRAGTGGSPPDAPAVARRRQAQALPPPEPAAMRPTPEPGKTQRAARQGDPAGDLRPVRGGQEEVVTAADAAVLAAGADRGRLARHLTTLEGWREFTTAETSPPELLPVRSGRRWPRPSQLPTTSTGWTITPGWPQSRPRRCGRWSAPGGG